MYKIIFRGRTIPAYRKPELMENFKMTCRGLKNYPGLRFIIIMSLYAFFPQFERPENAFFNLLSVNNASPAEKSLPYIY
jgi:hypothetical protein